MIVDQLSMSGEKNKSQALYLMLFRAITDALETFVACDSFSVVYSFDLWPITGLIARIRYDTLGLRLSQP